MRNFIVSALVIILFLISACSQEPSAGINQNQITEKNKVCTVSSDQTNYFDFVIKLCSSREECIKELKERGLLNPTNGDVRCEELIWIKAPMNCETDEHCMIMDKFRNVSRCKDGICEFSKKAAVYYGFVRPN